jgi:UDP-glucose 4-epimerase
MTNKRKLISVIAGGAGFIGVNLIPRLIEEGRYVVVIDNMSRGKVAYVQSLPENFQASIGIFEGDCADLAFLDRTFHSLLSSGYLIDEVWHLAANSDIPAGVKDANVDLKDTFMSTFNLLEVMKCYGITNLHFASSSAIYGDLGEAVLHESIGPLLPISNYGAMKLASEALASASAEAFLERVNLFRFPNVVGVPATHGVILDFVNKLLLTPSQLDVLGDGTQQKSYLHVTDLVSAMLMIRAQPLASKVSIVNIGPVDEGVSVKWIAEQVVERVSPNAKIKFGIGKRGWVGDVPKFTYSTEKLQSYGWTPELNSAGAVKRAIDEIALQLSCLT